MTGNIIPKSKLHWRTLSTYMKNEEWSLSQMPFLIRKVLPWFRPSYWTLWQEIGLFNSSTSKNWTEVLGPGDVSGLDEIHRLAVAFRYSLRLTWGLSLKTYGVRANGSLLALQGPEKTCLKHAILKRCGVISHCDGSDTLDWCLVNLEYSILQYLFAWHVQKRHKTEYKINK